MKAKLCILIFAVILQCEISLAQRQWISPQTTAQEMRNPSTWYRPYYQAAAEAYSNYFQNAQQIRNQLWQQAYATGAFGGGNRPNQPGGTIGGTTNQAGGIAGGAAGQAGGTAGGLANQTPNWG